MLETNKSDPSDNSAKIASFNATQLDRKDNHRKELHFLLDDEDDDRENEDDLIRSSSHVNGLRAERKYNRLKQFWEQQPRQRTQSNSSKQRPLKLTKSDPLTAKKFLGPVPSPRTKTMISSGNLTSKAFLDILE